MDEYLCDDLQDLSEVFGIIDRPEGERSVRDLVNAHAAVHDAVTGRTPAMRGAAAAHHGIANRVSPELAAQMVHRPELQEFVVFAAPFFSGDAIQDAAGSWMLAPEHAAEFCMRVKLNDHPDVQHPTRRLCEFLKESRLRNRLQSKGQVWGVLAVY